MLQKGIQNTVQENMSLKRLFNCLNCSLVLLFMLILQTAAAQENFASLDQLLDAKKVQAGGKLITLIYKDGKAVYKKEVGEDYKISTPLPIGAASKWLTAALVMTFVEKGELRLDDPVAKYIPMFTAYSKSYITIRHCLAEITGIESEPKRLTKILQKRKFDSLEEEANYYAKNKEIITSPGKEFFYGDIGYVLVGRVLEVIAKKKSFSKLMQERITKPLTMKKTTFMRDSGAEDPANGAVATADDLAKFLSMLLNHGELYGKKILTDKSILEMEKISFAGLPVKSTPAMTTGFNYSFGAWVQESDKSGKAAVVSAPGLNGVWPYLDHCRNYACVIFTKQPENEQNPNPYLEIKQEVEKLFKSNCQ